jgi:hypothetical protein
MISNKFLSDLNLYVSDNLSTSYTLDLQGVNYGIAIQIDEVSMKPNNSYQDKLDIGAPAPPKELIQERDNLLRDLLGQREQLEQEIAERKQANQAEVKKAEELPVPQ